MNKIWTRICPILGLLLLLSVCPLLSDSKYQVTCQKNSDNGGNSYFKQAKCISGSNSFPEGDGGVLNADLSNWFDGRNCYDSKGLRIHAEHDNGEQLLPGIGGSPGKIFNSCQTQGNPFPFPFPFTYLVFSSKLYEKSNVPKNLSKTGNSLQGMGYTQNLRWAVPGGHLFVFYVFVVFFIYY